MPVDEKITQITSTQALDDTDLIPQVHNMATTPVTKGKTVALTRRGLLKDTTIISGMLLAWSSATAIIVGKGWCFAENGDFIFTDVAITKSGLSLSANTWYHIYVYLSGGAAAAEVVTTAPVVWKGTAYSKTADTSRRYVGSVRTDGSGNVLKFQFYYYENKIKYVDVINNGTPYRVLNGGSATVNTAVALTSVVPTTATYVDMVIINNGTPNLDLTNAASQSIVRVPASTRTYFQSYHESQNIYYINSTTGGSAVIEITGYGFNR